MEIAGCSAAGFASRPCNEDAVGCFPEQRLAVVVDGMGGMLGGQLTRVPVLAALRSSLRAVPADECVLQEDALRALRSALDRANEAVRAIEPALGPSARGVMASVATLWAPGNFLLIGHVGHVRVYRLRAGVLEALTRDHTLVNEFPSTAGELPYKTACGVVTRTLGGGREVRAEIRVEQPQRGDVYLLCSSGVWSVLSDAVLLETMKEAAHGGIATLARSLVNRAAAAGAREHISAVFFRWTGRSEPYVVKEELEPLQPDRLAEEFSRRAFRPRRMHVEKTYALASRFREPSEAWESLAIEGFVPFEWVGNPERVFLEAKPSGVDVSRDRLRGVLDELFREGALIQEVLPAARGELMTVRYHAVHSHPATVRDCALFAADIQGMQTAELLSMEVSRRMAPWGGDSPSRFVWLTSNDDSAELLRRGWEARQGISTAFGMTDWVRAPPGSNRWLDPMAVPGSVRWRWQWALSGALLWRGQGLSLGPLPPWNTTLSGHPFADLPCPFDPLCELFHTGYMLDALSPSGTVLVAPG